MRVSKTSNEVMSRLWDKYQYLEVPYSKGKRFISVDPGLGGTGWAVWDNNSLPSCVPPYNSGSVVGAGLTFIQRAVDVAVQIKEVCDALNVQGGFMEVPTHMESAKGRIAEAKDDIVKLSSVFGAVAALALNPSDGRFCVPIPIAHWKGSTKKDHTERRLARRLPNWSPTSSTDHETDAVGIGLFVKGWYEDTIAPPTNLESEYFG